MPKIELLNQLNNLKAVMKQEEVSVQSHLNLITNSE